MSKLIYALYIVLVGLVLAGLVHIIVILAIPTFAERDAWARLSQKGENWAFQSVAPPETGSGPLGPTDPAFGSIACRFDLSQAPLVVRAEGQLPFWSASIISKTGRNIYSFNDRTAVGRRLFLIVVTPVQMAQLRTNPPEEAEQAVLVEADMNEGFVLIRSLQEDRSWKERVSDFLNSATCERYTLPDTALSGEPDRVIEDTN